MSLSNLELERQVLGLAMTNERHLNAVLDQVQETDFVTPKHREILRGMRELAGKGEGVDLVSMGSMFPDYAPELSHMTSLAIDGSGKAHI